MQPLFTAGAVVLLVLGVTGCTTAASPSPATSSTEDSAALSGSITVYAAASLTDVFTTLGREFEATYPGSSVAFNFAGSSDLVSQLVEGAPADVFASADENNMEKAVDGGVIDGEPQLFATNSLEIAVAPGNPRAVASLADLARPDLKIVLCASQVPCGAASERVAETAGVAITPVSEESSVTDVLAKVTSGQADAGLVYVTDITRAGASVTGVAFPESSEAVNRYPIAAVTDSRNPDLATAFVAFVRGDDGRTVLSAAGFGAP